MDSYIPEEGRRKAPPEEKRKQAPDQPPASGPAPVGDSALHGPEGKGSPGYWPGMPNYPSSVRPARPAEAERRSTSGAAPGVDQAGSANFGGGQPSGYQPTTGQPATPRASNGGYRAPVETAPAWQQASQQPSQNASQLTGQPTSQPATQTVPQQTWQPTPPQSGQAAPQQARQFPSQQPYQLVPQRPSQPVPQPQGRPVVPSREAMPNHPQAVNYQRQPGRPATGRPGGVPGGIYGAPSRKGNPPVPPRRRRLGCGSVLGLGLFAMALALLVFGGLLFGYVGIASALPSPEDLQARANQFASTQIYDRQGGILNEIADPNYGRRTAVTLDNISKNLVNATISTEDPNFYQHPGVDPVGLTRAVYYAVRDPGGDIGPGGSTITQQLVKLVYLSPERTITRKVKEAVLAAEITRRYDKNTVLQIYLNEIYYGNLAYGIEAASETYFGKHAKDLDLAEAAMVAGLPQAPAYYDPYTKLWDADGQPGAVKRRQGVVLGLMVRHGYITAQEADAAYKEPLNLRPVQQSYATKYPHFVNYVRSDVEQVLGPALLAKGGLKIYTTLDPKLQDISQQEVAAQVKKLAPQHATNSALVAVRPATGEILAMVGSADFNNEKISGQINMAITPRQPGSSIKPLTYLTAFSMPAPQMDDKTQPSDAISALEPAGYWTPATAILDIRTEFPDGQGRPPYVPHNYDNKEHGTVSVRSALANSYNIPAVKALEHVGIEKLKDTANRLGITTLTRSDYGLSLTLGGGEVTLVEMTGAYATLANGGLRAPLSPVACVVDADGNAIWRGNAADQVQGCKAAKTPAPLLVNPEQAKPAVDPQATYLITSILSDLKARQPAFGSAAELLSLPDRPAAAKTGTTNDNRDGWTLGYTPDLAVGVWVGNADYTAMKDVAGSVGAAPIWHNVMSRGLEGTAPKQFPVPPGIRRMKVCADSGTLPSEACPNQREEFFAEGRDPLPPRFDLHQRLRIDKMTGRLATDFTPADRVETKDFVIFPPRYKAWADAHGYPQPDLDQKQYAFAPELTINSPGQNTRVQGSVQIMGRVHLPEPLVWRLEYGVGQSPEGWGVLNGPQTGDVDGAVGDWDTAQTVAKHDTDGFSLRLAAYEPDNLDYPVAVSNLVYVTVEDILPTEEPPTATPRRRATRTPTVAPEATETPVPTETPAPTEAPPATATPEATSSPTRETGEITPTATATETTAGAVRAAITEPAAGAQVSGPVAIMGEAAGPGFRAYELQYAAGAEPAGDAWQPIQSPQTESSITKGGLLGIWQTGNVAPGMYTVRLVVLDEGGERHVVDTMVEVAGPGQ